MEKFTKERRIQAMKEFQKSIGLITPEEKLKQETTYYDDHLDRDSAIKKWLDNKDAVIIGMNTFYDRFSEREVLTVQYYL